MPLETFPFDAADYLKTEEDISWFLEAAAEDEDPASLAHAEEIVARARLRWNLPEPKD